MKRRCRICGKFFQAKSNRVYCSAECRKKGRKVYQKTWRRKHPDYHSKWLKKFEEREIWLTTHKGYFEDYLRKWKTLKKEKYREYMRGYMRQYRRTKNRTISNREC